MLTLFHFWSSTCSRKVRIALAEKDINWKSHHIDIVNKLENLEPEYLKINPNGVVPTLKHDGKVIIESNIIIEYIDDTFSGVKLKPDDTFQRAVMRLWLETAEAKVHKNVNVVSYNKRHVPRMDKLFSKEQQREILMRLPDAEKRAVMLKRLDFGVSEEDEVFAVRQLNDVMDKMERTLGDSKWLAGECFSLADIAIIPFVERFQANGIASLVNWFARPRTGNWWQRVQQRKSYQTAYAFEDPNV